MGLGDEILATAQVKESHAEFPDHQISVGGYDPPEIRNWADKTVNVSPYPDGGIWSVEQEIIFRHNPKITEGRKVNLKEPCVWVKNYAGSRPYFTDVGLNGVWPKKYKFKDFQASPGEFFFSEEEEKKYEEFKSKYSDCILLNPAIKNGLCEGNKDWGIKKWQKLAERLGGEGHGLVQSTHGNAGVAQEFFPNERTNNPLLLLYNSRGMVFADTYSFRDMVQLIRATKLCVTTEGAVHHAAAAVGKPAVVIFGGRMSPKMLGYESHHNLYVELEMAIDEQLAGSQHNRVSKAASPCGMHDPCAHCRECMDRITVDMVIESVSEALR